MLNSFNQSAYCSVTFHNVFCEARMDLEERVSVIRKPQLGRGLIWPLQDVCGARWLMRSFADKVRRGGGRVA